MLSHSLQDERRHGWVDHLGRRESWSPGQERGLYKVLRGRRGGCRRSCLAWERVVKGLACLQFFIFRHWGALKFLLVQVHWSLKIFGVPMFCDLVLWCFVRKTSTELCVPCCPYKEKITQKILCFCVPKTKLTHACALPCHPYLLVLVYFSHFHFSSSFL